MDGTRIADYAQTAGRDTARRVMDRLKAKELIDGNRRFDEVHPARYQAGSQAGPLPKA